MRNLILCTITINAFCEENPSDIQVKHEKALWWPQQPLSQKETKYQSQTRNANFVKILLTSNWPLAILKPNIWPHLWMVILTLTGMHFWKSCFLLRYRATCPSRLFWEETIPTNWYNTNRCIENNVDNVEREQGGPVYRFTHRATDGL